MTGDDTLRAGDEDRDRVATLLGTAFAQGRLTQEEYDQRLDACHRAVTFGDLAGLTADLPGGGAVVSAAESAAAPPPPAVPPPPQPAPAPPAEDSGRSLAAGWSAWAGVSVLVTVIWLGTVLTRGDGPVPSFWPIWVIGPWGAAMVVASLTRRGGS
jgi:hypothetical protein